MVRWRVIAWVISVLVWVVSMGCPAGQPAWAAQPELEQSGRAAVVSVGQAPSEHTRSRTGRRSELTRPIHHRWWGTEIVLRARTVRKMGKAIALGAGAAGVAAVLSAAGVVSSVAAIPSGLTAAVLTLGRAALEVCNWGNHGIRILVPRLAPVATCLPR